MVRFGMVAMVLALAAAPLVAQESTESLKKELESLRAEVDGLKAQRFESKELPASMAPEGDSPVMTALKETKLSGFVDTGYMVTFNAPMPAAGAALKGRVFDTNPNSFYLNSVQLNLERLANEKLIVGYHLELAAGNDVGLYTPGGPGIGLQEGWLQVLAPVGSGLDVRVGKMATLAGYEVIESMSNNQYSRGVLFGFAIPFTHTGIRAAHSLTKELGFTVGVNNGWNAPGSTFVDNNYGKTLELQVAVAVKDVKAFLTAYVGDESVAGNPYAKRYVIDAVVELKMGQITLALNADIGSQQGTVAVANDGQSWSGVAAHAKYQMNDWFAPSIRVEYFSDADGANFGVAGEGGAGARIISTTLTAEAKVASQLILRVELRFDNSNDHDFARGSNAAKGQNTLGFEAIMPF